MDVHFSDEEIIFIYGHFRKEARKLEEIKASKDCPISKDNLNQDIKLFNDIADKMRETCPELSKLDAYKI